MTVTNVTSWFGGRTRSASPIATLGLPEYLALACPPPHHHHLALGQLPFDPATLRNYDRLLNCAGGPVKPTFTLDFSGRSTLESSGRLWLNATLSLTLKTGDDVMHKIIIGTARRYGIVREINETGKNTLQNRGLGNVIIMILRGRQTLTNPSIQREQQGGPAETMDT